MITITCVTCVYCGHHYPEGTPPHGSDVLTEHIKGCEKHPMRALEEANKALVLALECADEALSSCVTAFRDDDFKLKVPLFQQFNDTKVGEAGLRVREALREHRP